MARHKKGNCRWYIPKDIPVRGYSIHEPSIGTPESAYYNNTNRGPTDPDKHRKKKELNYKLPEHLDHIGARMKWQKQ